MAVDKLLTHILDFRLDKAVSDDNLYKILKRNKKEQYKPKKPYVLLDEKRKAIAQLRKKISKFGIDPNDSGIFTRNNLLPEKRNR